MRYGPDGKVDLGTVDALARSVAVAVAVEREREEMKRAVSMKDIQQSYFDLIHHWFGHLYEEMVKRGANAHSAALHMASDPSFVRVAQSAGPELLGTLSSFWTRVLEPGHLHMEDFHGGKVVFGGDLFPSYASNIASVCGLYTDTIILPDPFVRSADAIERMPPQRSAYYFAKHALNILQYRDLALADVNPSILVVLPDRSSLDPDERALLSDTAESDALIHAEKVFGRSFESFKEVLKYAEQFDTVEKAAASVAEAKRVLFDVEWNSGLPAQIDQAVKQYGGDNLVPAHPGTMLALQAFGRMRQANDLLLRSQRLGGTPFIDAPTSWRYFQWKLEYDVARMSPERLSNCMWYGDFRLLVAPRWSGSGRFRAKLLWK